jgi:3-methyladenine DNA glycosylase AlkC
MRDGKKREKGQNCNSKLEQKKVEDPFCLHTQWWGLHEESRLRVVSASGLKPRLGAAKWPKSFKSRDANHAAIKTNVQHPRQRQCDVQQNFHPFGPASIT